MEQEISTIEENKGGVESRKGYTFQDSTLISDLILGITNSRFCFAYTEHHQDYLLIFEDRIDAVQVKKRESHLPKWSINKEFCQEIILPFYDTSSKIKTEKQKRFIFRTNGGIEGSAKKTNSLFHLCKITEAGKENCSSEDLKFVEEVTEKIAKILEKDKNDGLLLGVVWNLRYQSSESLEASVRSNRDLLQDQLRFLQITHQQAEMIYDRLLALVTKAGAEINDRCLDEVNKILNDLTLSDKEKAQKISQLKRCIPKSAIIDCLMFQNSPLAGMIKIFELPKEPLNFQKMMLLAGIPQTLVDLAANEYFNIDYHRRFINGILGEMGEDWLDHTKGKIYSIWGNAYSTTEKEDFGNKIYALCRKQIAEGIKDKNLITPVLQHDVHAFGLLHELAEDNKITYLKDEK